MSQQEALSYIQPGPQGQQINGDLSTLYRLVGFYEYSNSLILLDELLKISTEAEIEAYNKILAPRGEFSIFSNLSRFAGGAMNDGAMKTGAMKTGGEKDGRPGSFSMVATDDVDHARQGLDWVMALARLELLAMVSVYGDEAHRAALSPPSAFERSAFSELLVDGMNTHVALVLNDRQFERMLRRIPDGEMVSYARRLSLVLRFINTVAAVYGEDLTPRQREDLTTWSRRIDSQKDQLVAKIRSYLIRTRKALSANGKLRSCLDGCIDQLGAMDSLFK